MGTPKQTCFRILITFGLFFPVTGIAEPAILTATESVLPRYQSQSIDRDFPATDVLLDGTSLYVSGRRSLWRWDIDSKSLRRIHLLKNKEPGHLHNLVSDGLAIMTSSDQSVFRIQKNPLKVLKFSHPMAGEGKTIGLTGHGDQIFWVHTSAIMHVDRYGRTLIPRHAKTGLRSRDKVELDPDNDILWSARGDKIQRISLDHEGQSPKIVFDAKNPILGIQRVGSQLMAHTTRTVIRLDSDGNHLQSIPVTGSRSLATMQISDQQHAYLFSDGLLEVFNLKSKTQHRYQLPLQSPKTATLAMGEAIAVVIDDGIPRVFSLSQPVK